MARNYYETAAGATAWYATAGMADGTDDALEPVAGAPRGAPLVATWPRWALCTGALFASFVAAVLVRLTFARTDTTATFFAWLSIPMLVLQGSLVLAMLRAEESRLARELRTARTGTAMLRGMTVRRRQRGTFLSRLFAVKLGAAAVLVAEGDTSGAGDLLSSTSVFVRGGRLDRLRAVVDADLERATGTSVGLERCVQQLREMEPLGNREAELYRTHVLVKALLEQGDGESAAEVVGELERLDPVDEEEQLYATWLRVWFDLDAAGEPVGYRNAAVAPPEGQLRMATLVARAQGADKLVEKLERRLSSIAHAGHDE
jgi:hypothetical protein